MFGWVKYRQGREWVPLLVTHRLEDDRVAGVAFSGRHGQMGWGRPVMTVDGAPRGELNGQWQPVSIEALPEAEVVEEPLTIEEHDDLTLLDGLGRTTATWLANEGFATFAALANATEEELTALVDSDDRPYNVTAEKLDAWHHAAIARTS